MTFLVEGYNPIITGKKVFFGKTTFFMKHENTFLIYLKDAGVMGYGPFIEGEKVEKKFEKWSFIKNKHCKILVSFSDKEWNSIQAHETAYKLM